MRRLRFAAVTAARIGVAICAFACVGTTGGQLLTFHAAAAGPTDARPMLQFATDRGWDVVLTNAVLHIGALYLNQGLPVSGSQGTTCILPGTYVAQVTPALGFDPRLDINLLSPTPQRFPVDGQGTTIPTALGGQVWLTGGDVNSTVDTTPILVIKGTADDANGTIIRFEGTITIGSNRRTTGSQAAGADPICKERIVSISSDVTVKPTGGLLLRVDARQLFNNVDFGQLTKLSDTVYGFSDEPSSPEYTQPSRQLYENLRSAGTLYAFSWSDDL